MNFKLLFASILSLMTLPATFTTAATVPDGGNITTVIQSGETEIEVEGDAVWTQQIEINQARSGLNIIGNGGTVLLDSGISLFSNFSYSGNNISLTDLLFRPNSPTQINRWLFAMETGNVSSYINLEGSIIEGFRTTPDKGGNFMYAYGSSDITVNGGAAGLTIRNNRAEWDSAGGLAIMDGRVTMLGNITFENNWTGNYGGAVTLYDRNNSLTFSDGHVAFNNNHAVVFGGAMDVWGNQNTVIFNSTAEFNGNYVHYTGPIATEDSPRHVTDQHARGGAINIGYIASAGNGASVTFNDTVTFTGNYAISSGTAANTRNALGGAVSVYGNGNAYRYSLNFNAAAIFEGNYVYAVDSAGTGNGGAIFYDTDQAVLNLASGSRFSDNYAKTYGGAIYLQAGTINLNATSGDITFQGNRHGASFDGDYRPITGSGTPNAIYLGSGGNLNILASDGNTVYFYDPIGSIQGSNVIVTKTGGGNTIFSGDGSDSDLYWSNIQATTNVNAGRFILTSGARYGNQSTGNFNVAQNATLLGGAGSILYTPQLALAAGGLLGVSEGIFNLNATSISLGDGATLFGNGQLNASSVLNMAGSVTANIDENAELVLNQALSGAGGLSKIGDGTLTLAVASLYTGTTAVTAGILAAGAENVFINSGAIALAEGATLELRDFDQAVNNLTGAGEVALGSADLRINTNIAGEFSGSISGSGALTKAGSETLTLSGENTYTGGTNIETGRIVATNGSVLGTGTVTWDNNGSLELNFDSDDSLENQLVATGALLKIGSGQATLTAADSSTASVAVNEGILAFEQAGAFTTGQFVIAAGAGAAFGSTASLSTNAYVQNDGTTLQVTYRDSDSAVITTGSALIGGDLVVDGFEPTVGAKASTLSDDSFLIISSNSMIMGDFLSVTFDDFTLPYDFIVATPGFNASRTEFYVGLGLAWFASANQSSGTFTLDDGEIFEVDVILSNQGIGNAWDGQTLTKAGDGELILSQVNTYTGETNINAGTLTTGAADAFAQSGRVTIADGATLNMNGFSQTARNLGGEGNVSMGSGDLTVISSEATIFSGIISGNGELIKEDDAALTLSGENTYTGGTSLNAGRIIATNANALGAGDISLADNTNLELNLSGDDTFSNLLQGTGALVISGGGNTTLNAAGSSVGDVNINAGTLTFAQSGAFNAASFTSAAGAGVVIGAASTLDVASFSQSGTSSLEVAFRDSNSAVITTDSASIGGTLFVSGFEPEAGSSASSLSDYQFLIISSNSAINGDFTSVSSSDFTSPYDFLVLASGFNSDRTEYSVGLGLAWFAQAAVSSGTFTLDAGESFDVDVLLSNQSAGSNWGGTSLTKEGSGELVLSEANTYTGTTSINAGTLTTGAADAFAQSSTVILAEGATLNMNGFDQTARNLDGAGDISMGAGDLTVISSSASTFSGNIGGSGALNKQGDETLTLSGTNVYSGGTNIQGGTLVATNANALGSGQITSANDTTLELDFDADGTLDNVINGSGALVKSGSGVATLGGAGSRVGNVNVNSGTLAFSQNGVFNASDFTTAAAGRVLVSSLSSLNTTSFTQTDGSSLEIGYRDSDSAVITTDSAQIGGTLTISGFTPEAGASATALAENQFLIISSGSGIVGEFSSVDIGTFNNPYDFIVLAPGFNAGRTEYSVGLGLAWFAAAAQSSGTFTLDDGQTFDVDVVLSDQLSGNNWNGTSLTKEGDGELVLSEANTYTGDTAINGGTLSTGADDAFARSEKVSIADGATLNMNGFDQTARNLGGEGAVNLGSGTLTVITDADSVFSGNISGSGGLIKQGDESLTLSGDNDFSGGTYIDDGRIIATGGQALGSGDITSDIDGTLELQFATDDNFGNLIDGIATLVKTGTGRAALTAGGSSATAVNIVEGTLALEQNGAFTASNLNTASGAGLYIGSLSTLTTGNLVQAANSRLEIGYRNSDTAVITTDTATIGGSLLITGFSPEAGATATSLTESQFLLISSGSAIQGNFSSVDIGSYDNPYDFIVLAPGFNADRTQYYVGLGLAWFASGNAASGTFTLGQGESFDVDVILSDQNGNGSWNGSGLTKAGEGNLTLSEVNTYTGDTAINGGTLTTAVADAFARSGKVSIADGATLNMNGFDQTARNLEGLGDITLGSGDLTVVSDANSNFGGSIEGSGSLFKNGNQNLTLSGSNAYTGGTSINAGRLIATSGEALGSGAITTAAAATLELAFASDSTLSNTLSGGGLVNSGSGKASLTGEGSSVGNVTNTGNLSVETGDAFTAESYTSQGGTTSIVGMSSIDAGSMFSQDGNSVLNVEVKADQAAIVADRAEIDGTLNISGFTGSNVTKASDLEDQRFNVIETTAGITGDFDEVNFGSVNSPADYLEVTGRLNEDSTVYSVGLDLTWFSGATTGNGIFTLGGANDRFEVDVVLGDQDLDFETDWDGQSLTKRGEGTLVLSAQNEYTGATNIEAGTLEAGTQNAIFSSNQVNMTDGATFNTGGFDQILNNLSGAGSILLDGDNYLTLNNSSDTQFGGNITGDGRLFKNGLGTLVLSGDSDYTGGSSIQQGRLVAGSGSALGGGDILVYDGAFLEMNTSGATTLANILSGEGTLDKTGSAALTLSADGSSIGNVNLNGGSLIFDQNGVFSTGNYSAAAGTETELASGAQLAVDNTFRVASGSDLTVGLSQNLTMGDSAITADSADISGSTLNISGFTAEAPVKASALADTRFTIIDTTSGITGDFTDVNFGSSREDSSDYLQVSGMLSGDRLQYTVGLTLSWLAGSSAHGNFTLDDSDEFFEVDIALENQTATSGWDGQSLTKRGIGTLLLSAVNTYSGPTNVEEGLLLVGDADSTGASINGDGVTVAGAGVLSGTGSISGTVSNSGTLAALNAIEAYSTSGPSTFTVGGMVNSGTVLLAGAEVGNRLVVNGDWESQGGSLVLNTVLGGDNSETDRLVLDGGTTSGTTSLVIRNRGGAGASTNVGILVVEAINGATTGTDAFSLSADSAGYRARKGTIVAGAYDYSLLRGGNGGDSESWYLSSVFSNGGSGGEGTGPARPEASVYIAQREAAESMFAIRMHDRQAGYELFREPEEGTFGPGAAWGIVYGGERRSRADGDNSSSKITHGGMMAGVDLVRMVKEDSGSFQAGVMAGAGMADIRSHLRDDRGYKAKGDVSGLTAGLYASWFQDSQRLQGLWADAWVQHGWFENELHGGGLPTESYDTRQWSASVEVGYLIPIYPDRPTSFGIEPVAQIVWSSYEGGRHTEDNGTRVRHGNEDNLSTRLGARFRAGVSTQGRVWIQPYAEAYWWHNTAQHKIKMDDDTVRSSLPRNSAEVRAGVGVQPASSVVINLEAIGRVSGHGYRDLGGQVGLRYEF